jgi:four helix bundle protein
MDEREFKRRTMQFGLDIIRLVEELPPSIAGRAIGRQLVRCGPSVGANYRAACRARSTADMIAKLGIVEEECDESAYWLEMIALANLLQRERVEPLHREANEILAMIVASRKTLKGS